MSILLKALKQAEADRQAASKSRPAVEGDGNGARVRADTLAVPPGRVEFDIQSAVTLDAGPGRNAPPLPAYGGLWITLALAVLSAAGFGYWMRGMSSMNPSPVTLSAMPATSIPTSVTRPDSAFSTGVIPPALNAQEAGPLQLRLDRQFDKLGSRPR